MSIITLKPKRDKPLRNRHPWVFSGAIARIDGVLDGGDLVQVVAHNDDLLGTGYWNGKSQIQVRMLAWGDEAVDEAFWVGRVKAAVTRRTMLLDLVQNNNAYRLINAEADGLPGLIVDKYGDYLVMQCLTLGIDVRKEMIANLLMDELKPSGIVERSDQSVRRKEGLEKMVGVLAGDAPPMPLIVDEHGIKFEVDLLTGHKTGLYLDQRENRQIVAAHTADADVLNLFSYTGGFGLFAARSAKSVTNIDSSIPVLEQAERNFELNGLNDEDRVEYMAADTFEILRHYRETERKFDVIIVDPPKFVNSQKDIKKASRGYKDLNMVAMQLLRPNGLLATFSCSGLMTADLFQKIVFGAAIDAGRDAQIVRWMWQAADHPISLTFPESAYLKGLLLRVY